MRPLEIWQVRSTRCPLAGVIRRWKFKIITATDSTLKFRAVKRLGLAYKQFGESVPLFKRLGGRFLPKNSRFRRRVEKVGLILFC
jgi:hypothetical protein